MNWPLVGRVREHMRRRDVTVRTITVADYGQSCFTTRMPQTTKPKSRRETTYEKAERLRRDKRFLTDHRSCGSFWVGIVLGDSGVYHRAFAISQQFMDEHGVKGGRVGCSCRAGARGQLCSHAILAENLRTEMETE